MKSLLPLLFCGACALTGGPEGRAVEPAVIPESRAVAGDSGIAGGFDPVVPGATAFRLPEVPATLRDPADRADYLALHYWDRFDFTDTSSVARPEISEQAYVDFLSILPYARNAAAAVDTLYTRAAACTEVLYYFIELGDKYLYEPNSPMHDEELHILMLRSLTDNPRIAEIDKLRPRRLLEMALKNRPGERAADFGFLDRDGRKRRMSHLEAEYTLLYFYDPTCDECERVKARLVSSPAIRAMVRSGRLAVLSVSVADGEAWREEVVPQGWTDGCDVAERLTRDGIYDLKAMPTLYLLDRGKRVLLKDASVDRIEARLGE